MSGDDDLRGIVKFHEHKIKDHDDMHKEHKGAIDALKGSIATLEKAITDSFNKLINRLTWGAIFILGAWFGASESGREVFAKLLEALTK